MPRGERAAPRRGSHGAAALALALALPLAPAPAADCADWNTREFFEAATVADVTSCLNAGATSWLCDMRIEVADGVTICLDARAELGARDENGWTPLHAAAAWNGNPAVVAALLDAGADPKARDENGWTPLHAAAAWNENPSVVAALLDAGADPKARDGDGKLPFDRAVDNEALVGTDAYWRLNDARF